MRSRESWSRPPSRVSRKSSGPISTRISSGGIPSRMSLYVEPDAAGLDAAPTVPALRVTFIGRYDPLEDDFEGKTYFATSLEEGNEPEFFGKRDKQRCGFLYLRSIRTGARALSLERGSLLDIILRLKEVRPRMWEETLSTLHDFDVANDPELGLSGILESIDEALNRYVPREWGGPPAPAGVTPNAPAFA